MNWLKAMLLMVVLGAILYGVNLVLNKSAPVESPGNNGAWSNADGPIGPPVVSHGTAGMSAPPGSAPAPQSQTPAGASAYGSGNYSPTNPPTGDSGNAAPPAGSSGYQASVYQPATPPIVNSDPAHSSIPATPVGLTTESPNTASSPGTASNLGGAAEFATAMDGVMKMLRDGRLADGLQQLTRWYDNRQLNPEQTRQLSDLLGRLAGTVVYSRQHLLLPPYEVKPGDRLETIAIEYQVPAALLAKINGIRDPDHLTPGDKLKVMRGPFMAIVSLNNREVTLAVQQCYAGRFQLTGVGRDATAQGGWKIDQKSIDLPGHPGIHHWIGFGNGLGFCGVSDPAAGDDSHRLTLSSRDAEDLFDILSVGASVVVR